MWQQIASVIKTPISPHQKPVKWEEGGQNAKRDDKDWEARQGFLQLCCMLCIVFL